MVLGGLGGAEPKLSSNPATGVGGTSGRCRGRPEKTREVVLIRAMRKEVNGVSRGGWMRRVRRKALKKQ